MSKGTGSGKPPKDKEEGAPPEQELPEGDVEVDVEPGIEVEGDVVETGDDGSETTESEELLDSLMRLKADFENYRKRMMREQTRIVETAEADLVKRLLPVIDNLERALKNAGEGEPQGLHEGVEMVLDQMIEVLGKEGLEVVDPQGEQFDPEHHEAMMVVETGECTEDTVIDVVQRGYRFRGILLRPAMVSVSCPVKG
ncbi:MAG: nucleotide exchange factor GrpE [Actinobacteria bacterium]|nr:nucleotide exchange factor GrpE [Actinomycetota bacterium]MCG2819098.1 nucleotide exchange factor GrpE [Actinomycetes bacterium]MBU4218705.1 nucleotide exchange factor GrpE [Actinomycetota bacterium]MBU4359434.1 nucleotide exchange factor GrpE [Actinomycetota bacterium]MBU4391305.1 nucleotide exchange factor GrpE [Actinomycetota bacterium]